MNVRLARLSILSVYVFAIAATPAFIYLTKP